jgi:hypothetical protein
VNLAAKRQGKTGMVAPGFLGAVGDGTTSEQYVTRTNNTIAAIRGLRDAQREAEGSPRVGEARPRDTSREEASIAADAAARREFFDDSPTLSDLKRMTPNMRNAAIALMAQKRANAADAQMAAVNQRQAASSQRAELDAQKAQAEAENSAQQIAVQQEANRIRAMELNRPQVLTGRNEFGQPSNQYLVDPWTGQPINQLPQGE